MTPDQLAKSGSEHSHQVALFAYVAVARLHGFETADAWSYGAPLSEITNSMIDCKPIPELEWLHAIPNGGARGDDAKTRAIRGGALKAEGVRSGIPDVFLPVPVWREGSPEDPSRIVYCGLYIEMKKPDLKPKKEGSKGGLSDDQIAFRDYARNNNYGWIVCYTWREAADAIQSYINYGK